MLQLFCDAELHKVIKSDDKVNLSRQIRRVFRRLKPNGNTKS